MPMILTYVDFTKTQKSRYLENKTFFLQLKKFINYKSWAILWGFPYWWDGGSRLHPPAKNLLIPPNQIFIAPPKVDLPPLINNFHVTTQ